MVRVVRQIVHLSNDPALGGVNRWLDAQLPRLDKAFEHSRVMVTPKTGKPPFLDADVIVIHFTMAWRSLLWLRNLRHRNPLAAVVLVEHSYSRAFEERYVPHVQRFRAMLRLAYGMVDKVIAVSHAQAAWLREAVPSLAAQPGKLQVIHPLTALDELRALPLRERHRGPLRICGYGRYAPQKGFDTLIEAMSLISPNVATLRLVGLGPEEKLLRLQALRLEHVQVEGPVKGPAALFGGIDALVLPSRYEPFGCVAAEGRAAGLPMILSNADGFNDHPVAAPQMRVNPDDAVALAGAISWLAAQDLAPMAEAARQSAEGLEAATTQAWDELLGGLVDHGTFLRAA